MTTKILLAAAFLFQILLSQKLSHPLRAESSDNIARKSISIVSFPDTVKILAILVQFQPDTDPRTSGDGRFDLLLPTEKIIDSPPHDSAYFADHFVFAQNYYSKASNGKQNIAATVFGEVITLKKQMKEYAPVNDNLPLVEMIKEAWYTVDSLYPGEIPFQQYSMFTVFHAGVGKDIDLRASLGYDPTPLDIPSLYFSLSSFQKLLGNSFDGISLKNSSFKIPNSVVLPETEVRRISSDFVLELSINGLLIASIGSHLGLPDLFDTKTGKTAIGRFGLMDGQSIFSFSGICPPEPSAWEKIYLGWTTPIEVFGTKTLNVPAVGLYSTGNDTIYKIPISAKEYYLVENRNRDAKENGHSISMKWNGQIITKSFTTDEKYFSNTNIDSVFGVVVDVDELDWSLPGIINDKNNYRGGILVWHIDETIIEKNIAANTINADPKKRGIDLEEADGSQDIGQSYDFGHPASGSEDGSPIDYWFRGNIFPNYKNEFSENTNPNSLSNTYAKSHVTLKNFSVAAPRMTFDVNVGDADIQLVKIIDEFSPFKNNHHKPLIDDVDRNGKQDFIYLNNDSIFVFRDNFKSLYNDTSGFFTKSKYASSIIENFFGNNKKSLATVSDTRYEIRSLSYPDTTTISIQTDTTITTPVHSYQNIIFVGKANGVVEQYSMPAGRTIYKPFNSAVKLIALLPNEQWVAANADSLKNSFGNNVWLGGKTASELVNARLESNDSVSSVVRFSDNSISIYDTRTLQLKQNFITGYSGNSTLAIADINRDGKLDIVVGTGSSLSVFNRNGTRVENFPFKTTDGGNVIGCPVVIGLKNSNSLAIVFGSTNGQVYAITEKGKMLPGFPLQTGGIVSSLAISNEYLSAASTDSSIYFWRVNNLFDTAKVYWNGFLADKNNSNFIDNKSLISQKSSELLPKKFAYNWPNPVYSGSTNIRYFLGKSGTVKIKIVNLAGELVEELNGTSYAGMDNEVQWNISKIQSGIYFAQITASGSGEEQSQIVKIAVVK